MENWNLSRPGATIKRGCGQAMAGPLIYLNAWFTPEVILISWFALRITRALRERDLEAMQGAVPHHLEGPPASDRGVPAVAVGVGSGAGRCSVRPGGGRRRRTTTTAFANTSGAS